MRFKIKGKPTRVSLPEARAILHACDSVLSYHNLEPKFPNRAISVKFKKMPEGVGGTAWHRGMEIEIAKDRTFSQTVTIILHEMLHIYIKIEEGSEKITSTLTAKLKKDVIKIANLLVDGTFQRAAYIAHSKIAYKLIDGEKDHYNKKQYHKKHPDSSGKRFRKITSTKEGNNNHERISGNKN